MLITPYKIDPSKHSLSDHMRFAFLIMESLLDRLDQSTVTGIVLIQDMSKMTMGHISLFSPTVAKKAMTVWQVQQPVSYTHLTLPTIYSV